MLSNVHFISGLPRSGSTLLSSLLRQNPRFSAAVTSPVASLLGALQPKISGGEFSSFFDDAIRADMLRGLFDSYYGRRLAGFPTDPVVFDTNRTWTGRAALLSQLYPDSRIVCCVRDVGWIVNSIESLLTKNPLQLSRMFDSQPGSSVYGRVEGLMNTEHGLIGLTWATLREAWFGEHAKRLILVPYDHLTKEPRRTLQRLYAELGEPSFEHDLNNVEYDEPDYDAQLGMPGLHTVRRKVEHRERMPCIPPDIFMKYASMHFWQRPEMNTRGVTII